MGITGIFLIMGTLRTFNYGIYAIFLILGNAVMQELYHQPSHSLGPGCSRSDLGHGALPIDS